MKRVLVGALGMLAFVACGREAGITSPERDARVPSSWAAVGTDPVSGAKIETNQDDYMPGEVVHVVGSGWAPNETVNLHMTEVPNTHADVDTNVVADAAGGFSIHYYDVQTHDLGVTFTLTATGQTSGSVAVAVFTDGLVTFSSTAPVTNVVSYAITTGGTTCTSTSFQVAPSLNISAGNVSSCVEVRAPNTVIVSGVTYTFTTWAAALQQQGNAIAFTTGTIGTDQWLKFAATQPSAGGTVTAQYAPPSNTPPTVTLTGNPPYSGGEGALINVSGTASDPGGSVASTLWTVTGVPAGVTCGFAVPGNLSTTVTCNDNFAGTVTVTLTATDNLGATGSASTTLSVSNVAPTATFNAPGSVSAGSPINLSLTSPFDPSTVDAGSLTYAFDCGLGAGYVTGPSSTSCPTTTPGSRNVKGKITDKDGGFTEYTATVTISNVLPTADAGGPYTVNEGSPVTITGTGSDPDGGAVSFLWSASPAGCTFGDATLASTTVTCADNGSFTLTLKVTDNENEFTTDDAALTVNNVAPIVNAFNGATINEGGTYTSSGTFTDPGADTWTATVNYGDGTGTQPLALGPGKTFSLSHVYTDDTGGPFTVTVTVTDDDTDSGSNTASVTVNNVPPSLNVGAATETINEGDTFSRNGSFTDPGADTWTATVNYGDGSGVQALALNPNKTFSLSHTYTDDTGGPFTVTVSISDGDGGSDTETITVTVNNVPPSLSVGAATASINEGDTFSRNGSFTDPGADTWTATVNYGDGGGNQSLTLNPNKTFSLSHQYLQDGVFTVTVSINDGDGGADTETITVTVANVLPTVSAGGDGNIFEGDTFSQNGSFTDPGADSWTATVDYGDGGGAQALTLNANKTFSLSHTYTDDMGSPFNITVKVFDDDGNSTDIVIVNVTNVAPNITNVEALPNAQGNIYPITQPVTIKATFSDPGADTWACVANATSPNIAPVTGTTGAGSGSHPNRICSSVLTFLSAGVYDVDIQVTDGDGGSDTETIQVIIYDPTAGFVTGGGWINAAGGSYTPDPSLSGKGTFGFVSKYVKNQTTPIGNTQFVFHAGNFNFHSTDYQFLIVNQNATNAQFKGTGTVEGSTGVYTFMLWATDGSPDRFRIKIWLSDPNNPIFDNLLGQTDSATPQAIASGAIQIQVPKK